MGASVVITGASSGIGAALALEMGRRGHSVGLIARRVEKLEELADRLRSEGAEVHVAAADVVDREAVAAAVADIESHLGPTAVLVANAGIGGRLDPAVGWDRESVRNVMEVNYFGATHAAEAVLPGMLERGAGSLVVVSSVAATRGLPGTGPYSASKAAVSALWESMRTQLAPKGIHVLTIHPGFVKTPLTDKNDISMPFIVSAEQAAIWMADAIGDKRKELTYPWQMAWLRWFMKRVPDWLFDLLVAGRGIQ